VGMPGSTSERVAVGYSKRAQLPALMCSIEDRYVSNMTEPVHRSGRSVRAPTAITEHDHGPPSHHLE